MKWFKLDCDFRYDPKVLSLIQQFGCQEACSFWVLLLAYIGENGMPGCEIQISEFGAHSANLLATFVGSKPKKVLTLVDASAKLGLICAERWTNDRRIYIPNMLKRLDDYTRKVRTKSEQSPENTAVEQNKKKNKNIEEEQKRGNGDASASLPQPISPPYLSLGEFGCAKMTEEQEIKLRAKLNGRLDEYIDRFDRWVHEAPEAKHAGVRRKDRHSYESILAWHDRDVKEGRQKPLLSAVEIAAEAADVAQIREIFRRKK